MHSIIRGHSAHALALAFLVVGCTGAGDVGARTEPLTVRVPEDFTSIQAAINALEPGDTIAIAPGDYVENLTLSAGISLVGAGADRTTLHGRIALDGADGVVRGLRITAIGASGLPATPYGVRGESASALISGNVIDGFAGGGIRLTGSEFATISGNLIQRNGVGIETFEAGPVRIADNVVANNTRAGIRIEDGEDITIVHNTVVGNGFGEALTIGGAGIVLTTFVREVVQNNVLVSNRAGINLLGTPGTYGHNLVWGNSTNYAGGASAATGDISLDPLFVNAPAGDFRLRSTSPAIDAGAVLRGQRALIELTRPRRFATASRRCAMPASPPNSLPRPALEGRRVAGLTLKDSSRRCTSRRSPRRSRSRRRTSRTRCSPGRR